MAEENPFADPNFGIDASNPFSDPDFGKPSSLARRAVGDTATSLAKGAVDLGATGYQIADAATLGGLDRVSGGLTGKIADLATAVGDKLTGHRVGAGSVAELFGDKGAAVTPRADMGGERISQNINQTNDALQKLYSPEQQAAFEKVQKADGFLDTVGESLKNPSTIVQSAIESLPVSLGMMGAVRRVAIGAANKAATEAAAKGLSLAEQNAAADAALARYSTGAPGIGTQMATDFATSGGQQGAQAKDAVLGLSDAEIETSPIFQQLRKTMSAEDARAKIADDAQLRGFVTAGVLSALTSPISAGLEGKAAVAGASRVAASKAARAYLGIKELGKAIGTEGLQETLQSGGEQVGTNEGMRAVDPNYDLSKDVGNQAAAGGLSGALMGGVFHGISELGDRHVKTADGTTIDAAAGPLSAAAATAVRGGLEPQLALPGPDTAYPGGPMISDAAGVTRPATYSDMTRDVQAAQRDADSLASTRAVTDLHLQQAVAGGMTYSLAHAQQIAQQYGDKHDTPMTVLPTPDGKFTAFPTAWVAEKYRTDYASIQPGPRALPSPDSPSSSGRMIADAAGEIRTATNREDQDAAARTASEAELGLTPDVKANAQRLRDRIEANRKARDAGTADSSTTTKGTTDEADEAARDGASNAAGVQRDGERVGRADDAAEATGRGDGNAADDQRQGDRTGQEGRDEAPVPAQEVAATVDEAAHAAASSPNNDLAPPTEAQAEAGNYRKGHLRLHGLDISIENPEGSERSGIGHDGKPWTSTIRHHYGYIRGTVGADKDHIDAFIKPGTATDHDGPVFVVDQRNPDTGAFDEHKVMLGYGSPLEAMRAYKANYPAGWKGAGALTQTTAQGFKAWAASGDTSKPFGRMQDETAAGRRATKSADTATAQGFVDRQAEVDRETARKAENARRFAEARAARQGKVDAAVADRFVARENAAADARDSARDAAQQEALRIATEEAASDRATAEGFVQRQAAADSERDANAKRIADMAAARKRVREAYRKAQADAHTGVASLDLTGDAPLSDVLMKWIGDRIKVAEASEKAALEVLRESPDEFNAIVESLGKVQAQQRAAAKAAPTKLENTGVDLRRHWEALRDKMKATNDAEGITALNEIFAATARADFFRDVLPATATPGAQKFVDLMRATVKPFKEWAGDSINRASTSWYSDKSPTETLENFVRGQTYIEGVGEGSTTEQRLAHLKGLADQYVDAVAQIIAPMRGQERVAPLAEKLGAWLFQDSLAKDLTWWARRGSPEALALTKARVFDFNEAREIYRRYLADLVQNETSANANAKKQPLSPPRIVKVVREGLPETRKGDVTPQQFKDTFGFADIGFGSWVKSKEDQSHLNAAFDAFSDLARFLGVDPKVIGFKGQLHFTLGALGHGAKAAATFHPGHPTESGPVQVINLTKTKGDGTVAHEWFHALDHFLRRDKNSGFAMDQLVRGLEYRYNLATIEAHMRRALLGQAWMTGAKRGGEVKNAIDIIRYYSRRPEKTQFFRDALALDGVRDAGSKNAYWSNSAEIPARAWEGFIGDKLGGTNNYLVNPAWSGAGMATPPSYKGTPYPTAADRPEFEAWFKALAASLDTSGDLPTIDHKKWAELKPMKDAEWQAAVDGLIQRVPEIFEQMQREKRIAAEQSAAAKAATFNAAAAAAAAEARDQAADNPPAVQDPTGMLDAASLDALFDSAAEDMQAETQRNPDVPDIGVRALNKQTPPKTELTAALVGETSKTANPTATALITEAAKQGVKGIDEAFSALTAIFGGGKIQSFPGGFDEDSYAKAKPHFEASLKAFQAAGKSLKDLFKLLIQQFGLGIKPYAVRFAQDMKLTAELGSQPSASEKLATWVEGKLRAKTAFSSIELFGQANEAFGGKQAEGKYTPKDAYDAVELAVNRVIASNDDYAAGATVAGAKADIADLDALTKLLPTQTKRTEEQDEYQQFSTVPALAYVANWVADTKPGETMLEPSAGIGGLAAFAKASGANVVVNELSSRRAAVLRAALPDAQVFTENAEHINDVLPPEIKPTVIVMNPPFSSTAGRIQGQRDTMNGAMHVESALARLVPGGRLVAIVGNGMDESKPAFAAWWKKIKASYTVRANLNLNGAEYVKYGTAFDNNLLVIDKAGPTTDAVVTGRVESYSDLPALLAPIRDSRHEPSRDSFTPQRDESEQLGGREDAASGSDRSGDAERPGARGVGDRAGDQRDDAGRGDVGRGAGANGDGPDAGRPGASDVDRRGKRGRRPGAQSDRAGNADAGRDGSARVDPDPDRKLDTEVALDTSTREAGPSELSDSIFETYSPQKARIAGSKPHPGALVESAAMSAVDPLDVKYTPNLPKETIVSGKLSDAQLESVIYAGQAHQEFLPNGERRGFFIGDGTGVGKGREISGILLDNQRQGRKKHIWLSAKAGLFADAGRDFGGVGGEPKDLFELSDTAPKDAVKNKHGIMFATYDTLRGGEKKNPNEKDAKVKSRLDQIVEWAGEDFDGVIAFDEAHKMGNLGGEAGSRGTKEASKMALAGLALQTRLPKARIVYVSATGATEVSNLMFATRLGVWGANTAFESPEAFSTQIAAAGIASMELVARDLKAQGSYIARSLSFDGVGYERLDVPLSSLQNEIYNELATAWQGVLQNIEAALEATKQNKNANAKGAARSRFWGTHQRFFNQVITSMQTPAIIDRAQAEIANGNAVLFQLVNTNEATQEREAKKAQAEGTALEELDFSPRQVLIEYVKNSFPVAKYQESMNPETGKVTSEPIKDSQGNPVFDRAMIEQRDALIQKLEAIRVPDNPIDLILNALGSNNVAEVTGRSRRFVQQIDKDGSYKLVEEKRGNSAARADALDFQADKRSALIFSDAGGTGYSFHADRTAKNQRKRIHFLVQAGWRADSAVQGFGRSHRSNEVSQPTYILPTTSLKAQRRFISSIARRLDQLGALTKGQRNTGSQGLFTNRDNLESKYASAALRLLLTDMAPTSGRAMAVLDKRAPEFIKAMGLEGIYDEKTGGIVESKMPPITQFLNRLLSLRTDQQDDLFTEFENRMDAAIDAAVKEGTYDDGMQTVRATSVDLKRDETVYTDPRSGARTRYVELAVTNPAPLNTIDAAMEDLRDRETPDNPATFYYDTQKKQVFGITSVRTSTGADGRETKRGYRVGVKGTGFSRMPGTYIANVEAIEKGGSRLRRLEGDGATERQAPYSELRYFRLTEEAFRSMWQLEYDAAPKTVTTPLHMLTGVLLPVWDRMQTDGFGQTASVVRTQTTSGERFIGRVLPDMTRKQVLKNFGIGALRADIPADELIGRILKGGETAQLANGWLIKRVRVANENRMELQAGYVSEQQKAILRQQGAFVERISYAERVFLPTGPNQAKVFDAITRDAGRPVVEMLSPKAAEDDDPAMGQAAEPRGFAPLTPVTENPLMRRWFAGSKVVDAAGRPLVVYHGTAADVQAFSEEHFGEGDGNADWGDGFYFTDAPHVASGYAQGDGGNVMPVFLKITNPATNEVMRSADVVDALDDGYFDTAKDVLAKMGYDGIIYTHEDGGREFVAFEPTQIKSAIGNTGKFDPLSEDVLARAGDRRPQVSPLDASIVDMAKSGANVTSMLERIALVSTSAYNKVLARALLQTGVKSTVEFGSPEGMNFRYDDLNYTAAYRPVSDRVSLFREAGAEKSLLHELTHAATVRAIARGGIAAQELKALIAQVRASSEIDQGLYGLRDEYEFIAEAFSNPDFQNALRGVPVKVSGMRSAWDIFVNLVRRILGLQPGTALDEAIRIGANLMRENNAAPALTPDQVHGDAAMAYISYQGIKQNVQDAFHSVKTFNWWQRTVGTQYDKAQSNPLFKRVFDAGQRFLQDTSQIAMNAADLAPSILPKLGSIRDVFRAGVTEKDMAAVSKAVFQGTLTDKAVYTTDELRSKFGLTGDDDKGQIGLYREFRRATNRMLDETVASEASRLARSKVDAVTLAAAKADPRNAPAMIAAALRSIGENSTADQVDALAGRIGQLKAEGYAPLQRFGEHTVYVVGKDGEQIYFGMEEKESDASKLARQMKELYPDAVVTQGIMSKDAWTMFQGVSPDTLEIFAQAVGADQSDVFQEYLKRAINNRSAIKRLIERKGVAGFSTDVPRVLASFVTSSARMASKNYNMGEMTQAVEAIPKENGDVKDEAVRLTKYLQNPQDEAPAVRGLLFTHFIGGSIASALTNMTQPVLQTFPYLAQWGTSKAASSLGAAAVHVSTNAKGDADLEAAMARAEKDGVIAPHELHQLYAESIRGFGSNIYLRKAIKVWGSFFSLAESFNRRLTFVAAFNIGRGLTSEQLAAAGVKDAFDFAEKAIHETQGIYNRGNRPNWARGAIGATVFTFKQFSVSYLEFLKRLPPKERALALAILVMAAGTQGLPFAEDIEDIIDTIGQSLGYDTNSKRALREHAVKILGEGFGGFVTQGVSAIPGMPLDVQGRLGLSNLIPGTAILKRSNDDKLKEAFEVIGPLGAFVNSVSQAVSRAQQGDWTGIARMGFPLAIQNAIKGADMIQTGSYRDSKGRTTVKTTLGDAITKTIGFQPERVAEASERVNDFYQDSTLNTIVRGQIAERWARGMFEGDASKVRDAVDALRSWNEKNPSSVIRIDPATIRAKVVQMAMTSEQRSFKHAPKGLREEAAGLARQ